MWAPSLEEVFAEAAVALIAMMGEADGPPATEQVEVEARDVDSLFVDWLSEILFLFEARRFVPRGAAIRIDPEAGRIDAELEGVRIQTFMQHGPAVKAVTYHGLELREGEATVYLDV